MKYFSLIAAIAAAGLAFSACNKEEAAPATTSEAGKAITISINGANLTKATITGENNYSTTHNFSAIDLYFADAANQIVQSRRVTSGNGAEWTSLTDGTGVRYVGLDNVSKVYVIANPTGATVESGNMSSIILDLANYGGSVEEGQIPYIGADESITPLKEEILEGVGATIDPETGDSAEPQDGDMYYTAEVSIRPVVSRLEIGKISVVTTGTKEITGAEIGLTNDDAARTFKVEWEGFAPVLGGIYMSNFYASWQPAPVRTAVSGLFETPKDLNSIVAGEWSAATGITAAVNKEGISWYSNYVTSEYQQLFGAAPTADQSDPSKSVYFDGNKTKCVPFNFLVDYDLTQQGGDIDARTSMQPRFHFQFQFDRTGYSYKAYETTGGGETEITNASDPVLYNALVKDFVMPVTTGNLYYANVVSFKVSDAVQTIKPAKIYSMEEVTINPFNLTIGTVDPGSIHNVIVYVTVVDFDKITVTPSFE